MNLIRFLLINFLIINNSYAGDIKNKGYTLKEKSYVFNIEEAENLMERIQELESKERKLEAYIELEDIWNNKNDLYISNEAYYKKQISNLEEINSANYNLLKDYSKMRKRNRWENTAYFILGTAATIGSFIVVDKITDSAIDD